MYQEGFAFSHCTECRAVFKLRANVPPDRWWLRLRFQLLVARDHAFIFITVQMVKLLVLLISFFFFYTLASTIVISFLTLIFVHLHSHDL